MATDSPVVMSCWRGALTNVHGHSVSAIDLSCFVGGSGSSSLVQLRSTETIGVAAA